ncbi:MAG: thiamine phosphate synthase, partial [Thiothrix sp.]|nr:thiamine phosphate synthase [Thiothrix sp.]
MIPVAPDPLVAIGGIDHERARHLFATGVGSVAM